MSKSRNGITRKDGRTHLICGRTNSFRYWGCCTTKTCQHLQTLKGTEFRNSLAYRSWHRQNEGSGGFHNPDAKSRVATTVVDKATWEAMTSDG